MLSIRNFSGQLSVIKTTDEDLNVSYTFTDKMGHVVLSRQMKGSETHDTYYVYDDKGNLCFVLQPMYQSSANLDQYAFQYKYDGRNRCIWKKLPGAGYVEMVYDNADRLVFSQDGNQRALSTGNWMYYKYDGLNRLTEQGTCTNKVTTSGTNVLVQHFYDSYAFRSQAGFNNSNFPDDASGNGKGALTASVATVLGSSNKIYTAYYYDIKGRVAKTVQSNLLGGYDVTATVYTFTDKPATVTHTHTASGKPTRTEMYTYSYNHADRLLKVEHTLGGTKITLADYAYDNLGRLQSKSLHGSATNKLTYAYNVRGWLTGISGTKFTQNLYYNTGNGTARYNGSISSMTWKAGNESTVRGYKFTYDGLDRLLNATYGETAGINANTDRFSENVTAYDKNGNIKTLQRYGQTAASGYGLIDNLTFTLAGNLLNRVDDAAAASAYGGGFEFKDGVKQANEYTYDSNGNLTKDLNKGISTITYNVLNLPNMVTFSDGSTIAYTYGADGTKLKTVHKTGSTTTTTDYCGNVVYENGVQKLLLTDEGYVTLSDSKYHYYLKDHQGNNRVVINQSGTVEETNHYYPFGGVFASSGNVQPYKYNGKELDAKKGLNWYDYGARHYDAALGRFTTVDPSAENYYSTSPFTYCLNNPLNYIDPLGTDTVDVKDVDWNKFDPKKDVVALDEVAVSVPNALTKVGTRALEPISGFWGYVGYYLLDIGSTYHSEQTRFTYKVGTDGVITGVAPMVGTPPLPGFAKTSNLNTIRGLWSLTKQGSSKVMKHPIRGLFYKSKSDGLWWVKDQTKHGGSFYKVYKETNKGLEWHKDADKYGNFIINKHKSDVGIFIPWKELSK
ncbi:RHS repeat domain-containing protein [Bacteroides uniformis]|uniref:RHS repeat domain-containing protein n=1 Tax=Bacteroides uniformis TaxID=820 RepID=UPI0020B8626C|nr:RHS repeat-associated core domain-containing protein [Bacteroides uniformis]